MKQACAALFAAVVLLSLSVSVFADCGVEIVSGTAANDRINYSIKNTGTALESIQYNVTVNSGMVFTATSSLMAGETLRASEPYNFTPNNFVSYRIKVAATADCGANHSLEIVHWVFDKYTCSNPQGTETQNRCDYATGRYMTCRNGQWTAESSDAYCNNCRYHCGDGICNCAEGYSSCRADCESSCTEGYTSAYSCDGSIQTRQYKYRNCTAVWIAQMLCTGGCYDGSCSGPANPKCGVQITSFDYTNNVLTGSNGYVTVTSRNTGEATTRINSSITVDGIMRDFKYQNVNPGSDYITSLYYPSGATGQHTILIKSAAGCGSEDSRTSFITTISQSQQPVGPKPPGPEPPKPRVTLVSFYPSFIDTTVYTSKIVGVSMTSSRTQDFAITASGLPDGWVQYTNVVSVSDEKTAYIYITPKATGNYTLKVTARAAQESLNFSADIPVFVVEPGTVSSDSFLGQFWNDLKGYGRYLLENPVLLVVILVIIIIIVLLAGHHHLKRDRWPFG